MVLSSAAALGYWGLLCSQTTDFKLSLELPRRVHADEMKMLDAALWRIQCLSSKQRQFSITDVSYGKSKLKYALRHVPHGVSRSQLDKIPLVHKRMPPLPCKVQRDLVVHESIYDHRALAGAP